MHGHVSGGQVWGRRPHPGADMLPLRRVPRKRLRDWIIHLSPWTAPRSSGRHHKVSHKDPEDQSPNTYLTHLSPSLFSQLYLAGKARWRMVHRSITRPITLRHSHILWAGGPPGHPSPISMEAFCQASFSRPNFHLDHSQCQAACKTCFLLSLAWKKWFRSGLKRT